MDSSEQPARAGARRLIRRSLRAASVVVTLAAVTGTASLAGAASASAVAATQTEDDGRDVGKTILGLLIVLAILAALFLVIRRLRR